MQHLYTVTNASMVHVSSDLCKCNAPFTFIIFRLERETWTWTSFLPKKCYWPFYLHSLNIFFFMKQNDSVNFTQENIASRRVCTEMTNLWFHRIINNLYSFASVVPQYSNTYQTNNEDETTFTAYNILSWKTLFDVKL